jgi:DNA-binding transcriptional LysR family regulator
MTRISATPWFIRARLRTRHLQLLSAIGEEGNIHRAASMLNMSQPAASRLLRDLEDIVGTELFERLPRGVRANPYGEAIIRHARNALASLNAAAGEIDQLKSGRHGQVNLGTTCGPSVHLVPKAVARVARDNPLVGVRLQVDSSDVLLGRLREGTLDLVVGPLRRDDRAHCTYERLSDEQVCIAARRGHPLLGRSDLELRHLTEMVWIVPAAGSAPREQFELLFRDSGLPRPGRIIEATSSLMVVRLLEETSCLAVMARDVADYFAACGVIALLSVPLPRSMDSYGIITRQGTSLSPAARLLYTALLAESRAPGNGDLVSRRGIAAHAPVDVEGIRPT